MLNDVPQQKKKKKNWKLTSSQLALSDLEVKAFYVHVVVAVVDGGNIIFIPFNIIQLNDAIVA